MKILLSVLIAGIFTFFGGTGVQAAEEADESDLNATLMKWNIQ